MNKPLAPTRSVRVESSPAGFLYTHTDRRAAVLQRPTRFDTRQRGLS
jgi:hypothetical protein